MQTEFLLERLKGRDHLKDLGVAGRIILNFLGTLNLGTWIGFTRFGIGLDCCYEHGIEYLGFVKVGNFLMMTVFWNTVPCSLVEVNRRLSSSSNSPTFMQPKGSLPLLEEISYYFVLRYLIAYAETVLRCAEYIHQIR
jgi:hypothetical protein